LVSIRWDDVYPRRSGQCAAGLIAIFKDAYFAVTKGGLLFLDFAAWGWFRLIVGVLDVLVGFAILAARTWGRVVGVILLMLNVIVQFAFIAAFPSGRSRRSL
jgi:hypothetical protein